jgi:endogenous inhibitor of DNA gyrase (YacG/DUF329 family)
MDKQSSRAVSRCPICREPTERSFRPFCSKRCRDVDLARWLGGTYAIPGAEPADGELPEDTAADGRRRFEDDPEGH